MVSIGGEFGNMSDLMWLIVLLVLYHHCNAKLPILLKYNLVHLIAPFVCERGGLGVARPRCICNCVIQTLRSRCGWGCCTYPEA